MPSQFDNRTSSTASTVHSAKHFDPLIALLDEYNRRLDLSTTPPPICSPSPMPLPPSLLSLATSATNLAVHTAISKRELHLAESHIREAILDADRLDLARQRAVDDSCQSQHSLRIAQRQTHQSLSDRDAMRHELSILQEGIATLKATADLDARINALLIADQSEEIEQLRSKLSAADSRCDSLAESVRHISAHMDTSVVKGEKAGLLDVYKVINKNNERSVRNGADGLSYSTVESAVGSSVASNDKPPVSGPCPKQTISVSSVAQRVSQRSPMKREQLLSLQKHRDSLFKEYERRHSTTIDNVVRRNSQMFGGTPTTQVSKSVHSPLSQSGMSDSPVAPGKSGSELVT